MHQVAKCLRCAVPCSHHQTDLVVQKDGELFRGCQFFLFRNVVYTYSLRSDIYTILNAVVGRRLGIGSLTSSYRARSKAGSNDPSVSMMRYRERVLYRQDRQ